jgi:hypothetical protein
VLLHHTVRAGPGLGSSQQQDPVIHAASFGAVVRYSPAHRGRAECIQRTAPGTSGRSEIWDPVRDEPADLPSVAIDCPGSVAGRQSIYDRRGRRERPIPHRPVEGRLRRRPGGVPTPPAKPGCPPDAPLPPPSPPTSSAEVNLILYDVMSCHSHRISRPASGERNDNRGCPGGIILSPCVTYSSYCHHGDDRCCQMPSHHSLPRARLLSFLT